MRSNESIHKHLEIKYLLPLMRCKRWLKTISYRVDYVARNLWEILYSDFQYFTNFDYLYQNNVRFVDTTFLYVYLYYLHFISFVFYPDFLKF